MRVFGALTILLGWAGLSGCSGPTRVARAPKPAESHLTVLTYNVNYGIPGDAAGLAAMAEADADLVLLQETTSGWEEAIRSALSDRYPYISFLDAPAAGGLAILSKHRLETVEVQNPETPGAWFAAQRAVLDTSLGRVQVLNVHLRPQISDTGSVVSGYFTTSKVRAREIASHLKRLEPNLLTIVAGDFNESGGGALEVLEAQQFVSALSEFSPGEATWQWPTSVGNITSQLDHVAYSPGLEPLETRVLRTGRSDHFPVYAVFVNR